MQDHEGYARCHLHGSETWFWSYWRHGGLAIRHGWDEIGVRARKAMDAFVAPSPSYAYEATWDNVVVRVGGDVAWVTYDQRYPQSGSTAKTSRIYVLVGRTRHRAIKKQRALCKRYH